MLYSLATVLLLGSVANADPPPTFSTITNTMTCSFTNECGFHNVILTVKTADEHSVVVSPSSLMTPVYTDNTLSWTGNESLKTYTGEASVIVTLPGNKLEAVHNTGSGAIAVWGGFDYAQGLHVHSSGSGDTQFLDATVTGDLTIDLNGSGDITIVSSTGATNANIISEGSGDLNVVLKATEVTVQAQGSGDTTVAFASGQGAPTSIASTGSGGATVCNPSSVTGTVSGSGDVEVTPASISTTAITVTGSGDLENGDDDCDSLQFHDTTVVQFQNGATYDLYSNGSGGSIVYTEGSGSAQLALSYGCLAGAALLALL